MSTKGKLREPAFCYIDHATGEHDHMNAHIRTSKCEKGTTISAKGEISESTIARIAGNLMSGHVVSEPELRDERVRFAVAQARAIAAEVQRTTPKEEQ